jgi:hypothetical protein
LSFSRDALWLGEGDYINFTACVGSSSACDRHGRALICALSPRLPLRRVAIPGAAFIANIAYSAYLVQKLVIHGVAEFCRAQNIDSKSGPAPMGVELCVYAAAAILFFGSGTPFPAVASPLSPLVHLALVRDPGSARVSRAGFGGEFLAEIFRDLDQEAMKTGEDKEFLGIE